MGKRDKAHRKKVKARNLKIAQQKKSFSNKFREELLKEIEAEKIRRASEAPEPNGETISEDKENVENQ